ncbi:hypothetical protein Dimus_012174 [Dionaea muscipula]
MAAPTQAEEPPSEPLKYKTWALKVSIHCEGCKKKVRRILHNIEGVYTIDIDSKLHKVTVTGNVESDALIKKLEKSGKHAELWPENRDHIKEKKSSKLKKKHKDQSDPENSQGEDSEEEKGGAMDQPRKDHGEKGKSVEVAKAEGSPTAKNHGEVAVTGNSKIVEMSNPGKMMTVVKVQFKEAKVEGKKPEAAPPASESTLAPENKVPENDGGAVEKSGGGIGSGSGGKKKKKKGQNGNRENKEEGNPASDNGPTGNDSPLPVQIPGAGAVNLSPPIYHHTYEYSPRYYAPPPAYAVSYNTANPGSSHTASYYTAPPPYSYAYMYRAGAGDVEPPLPFDLASTAHGPSDSFEMLSEENPNACSVM